MQKKETQNPKETPPFEDDLRSDLFLGSQSVPDRSVFRERITFITPAKVISLVILLVLCILGWFMFAGPGKPGMEKLLTKLAVRVLTPTRTSISVAEISHEKTPTATTTLLPTQPSSTPTRILSSPTLKPTSAAVIAPTGTPTASLTPSPPPLPSPTTLPTSTLTSTSKPTASVAGCISAASISTADVGKSLCVTGKVLRTESNPSSFLILLENPKDAFYFLSYDRKWETLELGTCVFATGKILQLGNNPVMILDYKIPLEYCP